MNAVSTSQKHATRALRMNEHVAMSTGSRLDLIRNQTHSIVLQLCDGRRQVRNLHADMMQALPALVDELGDR